MLKNIFFVQSQTPQYASRTLSRGHNSEKGKGVECKTWRLKTSIKDWFVNVVF